MTTQNLKTPISYYGGKQQMLRHILPMIPNHHLYCEPFAGGAAVYWGKNPSPVEVINDTNEKLINFYRILQTHFGELHEYVRITLHSRKMFQRAWAVYNDLLPTNEIEQAWAIFMISSQSFGSQLKGSWGYDRTKSSISRKVMNKKRMFTDELRQRIELTQIECRDALSVIKAFDTPESFFYLDPPYPNSNQGHYAGYTIDDFEMLLKELVKIKGRFLLSNYPQAIMDGYVKANGWSQKSFKMSLCASKKSVKPTKTEVLTANYRI